MKSISIKSNSVLAILCTITVLFFLLVEHGKVDIKKRWYDEKLNASYLSSLAFQHLKESQLKNGVFIDAINDPNETALIGQEYSLITTGNGVFESKLKSTNPNFAAVIVDMLKSTKLKKGDHVAVAMTGSFPALNISTIAALQTLGLKPVIISSQGASNWGANSPELTWLDIEKQLFDADIFKVKSVAASVGGGNDIGRGLSPKGRELLKESITRNNIPMIYNNNLSKSIQKRLEIYKSSTQGKSIKAYINIGGGIASLGHPLNKELIQPGLSLNLPDINYPSHGVLHKLAKENIPIIQLLSIKELALKYGLTEEEHLLSEVGLGKVYRDIGYDILKTTILTSILLLLIFIVYRFDQKKRVLGKDVIPVKNSQNKPQIKSA